MTHDKLTLRKVSPGLRADLGLPPQGAPRCPEGRSGHEKRPHTSVKYHGSSGGAARNLPEAVRIRHRGFARPEDVGFGNMLIHDYFGVAAGVLWRAAKTDLLVPRVGIERVCEAEKENSR